MNVVPKGEGQYAIACGYFSRALVAAAKAVPGMRWDSAARQWRGYADAVAATVGRLRAEGLRIDTTALPEPDSWRTSRSPFLFSTKNLRAYQVEGVRFLIARSAEGALLADGLRLGKSCQALIAARAFKQKTLIICPSHVVGVWGRPVDSPEGPGEIAKWWPDAWLSDAVRNSSAEDLPGVHILEGVKRTDEQLTAIDAATVIVVSYDIVYAWVESLTAWNVATLIVDECHALQGHASRRSDAVRDLARYARRRMFLSGTPMTSRPRDLHNVLDTLAPGRFGYFFTHQKTDGSVSGSFSRLYCAAHQKTVGKGPEAKIVWDFDGASNLSEDAIEAPAVAAEESLHSRLRFLMVRRVKSEVDAELPPKTRQIVDVRIAAKAAITPTAGMFSDRGALRRSLDLSADAKIKSVIELVKTHAEEGEKVICFCYRRMFAERIAKELTEKNIAADYVHGGLTQKTRDARIHTARTHKGAFVLCCTIDTTSTGIDLSFSSVAVFGELSWEPHELLQAEERIYRFGSGEKPLVQYVIARGTGDEILVRGVIAKLDHFEQAIGTTGDRLREDLAKKKEEDETEGLKRLAGVLAAMQTEKVQRPKRPPGRSA